MSPKALKEKIQTAGKENSDETVLELILRHRHFTSVEPTTKSEELGPCFFMTAGPHFDKVKEFITAQIPSVWEKLDNTFLDELPPTVKCPRLTTSNLKNEATSKCAAWLSKATVADDEDTLSQWSKAP
jgi:hypothetical protein